MRLKLLLPLIILLFVPFVFADELPIIMYEEYSGELLYDWDVGVDDGRYGVQTDAVLEKFYSTYDDDLDFLILTPMVLTDHGSTLINQDLGGIGNAQTVELFPEVTSKLQSLIDIDLYRIYSIRKDDSVALNNLEVMDVLIHELVHTWCCYIDLPGVELPAHWVSNLDLFEGEGYVDFMGSYGWIKDVESQTCIDGTNLDVENRRLSELTLYLMGLIPAQDVSAIKIHDFEKIGEEYYDAWGPDCYDSPVFTGTREISIQDIKDLNGARVPAYGTSQKDFVAQFVLIVPYGESVDGGFLDYVKKYKLALPTEWAAITGGGSKLSYPDSVVKPNFDVHLDLGWNMFSIPFENPVSVNDFKVELAASSCEIFEPVWYFNPQTQVYEPVTVIQPHKSYWVFSTSDCDFSLQGYVDSFELDVNPGWNMVGSPYDELSFVELFEGCEIDNYIWEWESVLQGSFYDTVALSSFLTPFSGYWVYAFAECNAHEPVRINSKNMNFYSDREAFMVSDRDWHDVLPLVPLTVWTQQEDITSECQRGYLTPDNVCYYPTLTFDEELGEDRVLSLNVDKILEDEFIYVDVVPRKKPIFEQEVNAKSFSVTFDIPQDLLDLVVSAEDYYNNHFEFVVEGVKTTPVKNWEEEQAFSNLFQRRLMVNGVEEDLHNFEFFGSRLEAESRLYMNPWTDYELKVSGNEINLVAVDEDYIITKVKLYFGSRYLSSYSGFEGDDWVSLRNYDCDVFWIDLCIVDVVMDKSAVASGEELAYTYVVENVKDSPLDLRSTEEYDYVFRYGNTPHSFVLPLDREDFEFGLINPGERIELDFVGKNVLSDDPSFDADSLIYFLQQYTPSELNIFGSMPLELGNLLVAPASTSGGGGGGGSSYSGELVSSSSMNSDFSVGAGLSATQVNPMTVESYFDFWDYYGDVVYVEDNYELALLASSYASLINSPLVIVGSDYDLDSYLVGKNLICVGQIPNRRCDESFSLATLKNKYFELTETNKVILINPSDEDIVTYDLLTTEKSSDELISLYNHVSLLSPFLASAKHELLLTSASDDAYETNNNLKADLANFYSIPESYTCVGGEACSSGFEQHITNIDFLENEISFNVDFSISDVDVGTQFVNAEGYDVVLGQTKRIEGAVFNNGKTNLTEVNVSFYTARELEYDYFNDRDVFSDKVFIGSVILDFLEVGKYQTLAFVWTPEVRGDVFMVMEASIAEDVFYSNDLSWDLYFIRPDAPDVAGYWRNIWDTKFVVGQESEVKAQIRNVGTQTASDISVKAFIAEDWEGSIISDELGELVIDSLESGDEEEVLFNWIPEQEGYKYLVLNVSSSDDAVLDNNQDSHNIIVRGNSPVLWGGLYSDSNFIVGEQTNLVGHLENRGGVAAENVLLELVVTQDGSSEVLWTKSFETLDLDVWEEFSVPFTPSAEGDIEFTLSVSADNAESVELTHHDTVWPFGPNLQLRQMSDFSSIAIVEEETTIPLGVVNYGTSADNVVANLYELDSLEEVETRNLVESLDLGSVDGKKNFEFSWTPAEVREYTLQAELVVEGEIEPEDNTLYFGVAVFEEHGPDVLVDFVDHRDSVEEEGVINEIFTVVLRNRGSRPSGEFSLLFYVDDVLFEETVINNMDVGEFKQIKLGWPRVVGSHNFRLVLDIDDLIVENNVYDLDMDFYERQTTTFNLEDYDGSYSGAYALSFVNGPFSFEKLIESREPEPFIGEKELTFDNSDELSVVALHFFEGNVFSVFWAALLNSEVGDEESLVVDRLDSDFATNDFELSEVFVFDPSWGFNGVRAGFLSSMQSFDSLFACADWDFENAVCAVEWLQLDAMFGNEGSTDLRADAGDVEAIAVGKLLDQPAKRFSSDSKSFNSFNLRGTTEIEVGYSDDLWVEYEVDIPGIIFDCSKETIDLDVYLDDLFVRKTSVPCYDLEDFVVSSNYWPHWRITIGRNLDGLSGNLRFVLSEGKLAFDFEEWSSVRVERNVKVMGDTAGRDNIFECSSIEDCQIAGLQSMNFEESVADSESSFSFSGVDTSKDYLVLIDTVPSQNYNLEVNGENVDYDPDWNVKTYAEVPSHLVQEDMEIKLSKQHHYADDYKGSVQLVPRSDLYLTIFGSDDAIPQSEFMWYYSGGWGYNIKRALDPTLYADLYGNDLPDLAVGRILGITNSDVSSFVARNLLYDKLPLNANVKFMGSSFRDSLENADLRAQAFTDAGYNGVSVTSEEECYDFDPVEWEDQILISYDDHGSSSWAGIYSSEMPLLASSVVFNDACSTCSYMHHHTFCAMTLRQGGLAHFGAVSVAFSGNTMYHKTMNNVYYNNLDLGRAFQPVFDYGKYDYQTGLIGDPTFNPYKPYLLTEELPSWGWN